MMKTPANRRAKNSLEEQITRDGITIKVTFHAVEQYFKRIKGRDVRYSSGFERSEVRKHIAKCVTEPDTIHHKKTDMAPIHINGECAAVADPLKAKESDIAIPTVYHKSTFIDEEDGE